MGRKKVGITKLVVIERATNKRVHEVDVSSKAPSQAEKVMSGLLRNMDTDRFYVSEE